MSASVERLASVEAMRREALLREPDAQVRKDQMIATFRYNMDRAAPWLPGGAFIANPGLAKHILAALESYQSR